MRLSRAFLVGTLGLATGLVSCGKYVAQRDPWRRDAELACLKSQAVKEGPGVSLLRPIDGPGVCGAAFPLKITMLGHVSALGFAGEDRRPPSGLPATWGAPASPPPAYPPSASDQSDGPMSIRAPGLREADDAEFGPEQPDAAVEELQPQPGRLGPAALPPSGGTAAIMPPATLACPLVSVLDRWVSDSIQPAAMRWFGQPVVEIKQISAYSCRSMNGQRGARISEHAFGNALDIAAFTFADGRKVTVKNGWRGAPEERGFLHDVQATACRNFTTVLAPGSNAFHYDHIHVDLMRHANGRTICKPHAIPGDAVAARARDATASVGAAPSHGRALGFAADRKSAPFDGALEPAGPGED